MLYIDTWIFANLQSFFGIHLESTNLFGGSLPRVCQRLHKFLGKSHSKCLMVRNSMAKIVQWSDDDTTISQNLVGWVGGLESVGLGKTLSSNDPFYSVAPRPISTKPKSPIFFAHPFVFARPTHVLQCAKWKIHMGMAWSKGSWQVNCHLASPTQSPSKEATKVKVPSFQKHVWITGTTQNSWINRIITERRGIISMAWGGQSLIHHHHNKSSHPLHFGENPNAKKNVVRRIVEKLETCNSMQFQTQAGRFLATLATKNPRPPPKPTRLSSIFPRP